VSNVVRKTRPVRETPVTTSATLSARGSAHLDATERPSAPARGAIITGPASPSATEAPPTSVAAEDLVLVARAIAGDQRALRRIYAAHQGQVRGHLHRLLGADSEVDDLVQTVFSRAFAALDSFQGKSSLSTWLYRITTNTSHNLIRQRYRRQRLEQAVQWFGISTRSDITDASTVDARDEARRVLEQVRPDLREVFVLYHYEGLTLQEVAEVLERPLSTIGDQLSRARRQLRELARS
jgi:RNA polymerase sigma-70 factor (ECF subfamily)